jgi:hypothetical protein
MDYFVLRLYSDGCRVQKQVRNASRVRGVLRIGTEKVGQRSALVARLTPHEGFKPIPALLDASLLGMSGESWMLSGFELLEIGPLRRDCLVGQAWLVEPAATQDLIDAEARLASTLQKFEASQAQLAGLQRD